MFTTLTGNQNQDLTSDSSFIISPFDLLQIEIYTKAGESLIDPEMRLKESSNQSINQRKENLYQVNKNGNVKLPMIGEINLSGLSGTQAEDKIAVEFTSFYDKLYVTVNFKNKRVIVLGAAGGKVFPLNNENTTLVEVIAQAGGIDKSGNAKNIRLIRGEEVIVVDLSTVEGYKKANYIIQHGDIIYIEPVRRPVVETLRETTPVIGIISGLISITALLINITR